jgi:tetratricopeptide (TPR) repeat protein
LNSNLHNPFKGLRAYTSEDKGTLFGREKDLALIHDRIFSGKTTLLFGGSGVGKTSFLRAKLIPETEPECRVCYHNRWAAVPPLQALRNSILQLWPARTPGTSSSDFVADAALNVAASGIVRSSLKSMFALHATDDCILILDQFEEALLNYAGESYFEEFLEELCGLINDSELQVRVLFSMREEFLGELSVFDNRIPDLFNNYYRLKHPNKRDAVEIIERTCVLAGVKVESSRLNQLIVDLSESNRFLDSVSSEAGSSSTRSLRYDRVSPTYLQLVCQRLWQEQMPYGATDFFPRDYQPGQAAKILRTFCREKLLGLGEEEKKTIARAIGFLVSRRGAKMPYELQSLATLMTTGPKELRSALDKLVGEDIRILTSRPTSDGSIVYELYHDLYGPIMYEWKEEFEAELRSHQEEQDLRSRQLAEKAEPLLRASIAIYEDSLKPEHPNLIASLSTLAGLVERQGHYAEAERLLQRVLSIQEKENASEHGDVASTLTDLARVALLTPSDGPRRFAEAEDLLRRALQIRERTLGPEHVEVGASLASLARLLQQQQRYESAEPLFRRALEIQEKELGAEHLEVIANLNNLASLLRQQGRADEARSLSLRATKAKESSRDSDLEKWIRNKATEIGNDRKFRRLLAPVEELLRIVPSTPEESKRDWDYACTLFATEVLDGRINFARDIDSSSYWRLEGSCWVQEVKHSMAYVIWMHRGGGVDPVGKSKDYVEASSQILQKLLDPSTKSTAAEYVPIAEYLNARYLKDGKLDREKAHTKKMIEVKAHRFWEVDSAGDLENWSRADRYAEKFYESIIPAVTKNSADHVRRVLDALQVGQIHKSGDAVVNCFEMSIAVYFLDAAIVRTVLGD